MNDVNLIQAFILGLVQGIAEFPFYNFYLGAPNIQGVGYWPSFAPRLGPRIMWKDLGVVFTFALPIPTVEQQRRGSSEATEIVLNSYWRRNAIDLYYYRIRGFYASSPWSELDFSQPARYPQLPDAVVSDYGANWYFVIDPDQFSLKAAFDQNEFQVKSGGSFLINPFYNHFEMSLGTVLIPGIGDDSLQSVPNLASAKLDSIGSSVGGGYSFIKGRFFATGLASVGPGLQIQQVQTAAGDFNTYYNLAIKINVNLAAGWNLKSYVGGVKFLLDSMNSWVENTEVASNIWSGQLFLGARF